jgi:cyclophilin family peptidyl-prolyl cis-trans isomerase
MDLNFSCALADRNGRRAQFLFYVIFFTNFCFCFRLDGKHVVFGHIISGIDVLKKVEVKSGGCDRVPNADFSNWFQKYGTKNGKPSDKVTISSCGEVV